MTLRDHLTALQLRLGRIARRARRRPDTRPRRTHFESLEDRILFSIDLIGIPTWIEQGPGPITNGGAVAAPNNQVAGAVEAIVIDPTAPATAYAATVGGGVWRTDNLNATPANITWTPLTDDLGTLAISAIAISPLNNNVVFAGTGSYSNTFRNDITQMRQGLLRTTDGGTTWTPLGQATFQGDRIRAVLPTALGGSLANQVVLVAADDGGGVFRSNNGGGSFTQISGALGTGLPGGSASDLIGDPNNTQRFYAALPGLGVYRSDDGGQTWAAINTGLAGIAGSSNIELAAHDAGATTVLYVGIVDSTGTLSGVFRDAAGGDGVNNDGDGQTDEPDETNWAVIGAAAPAIHNGGQGVTNFSIVADPSNANFVYVGGDQPPNIFRGDASTGTWTSIVGAGAGGGTRPHADSRDLVFSGNTLYETDDGGIYRINNPSNAAANNWVAVTGDIRITEFHAVAFDSGDGFIFGGSQDNGSEVQTGVGSLTWNGFLGGDGQTQAYDATNDIRYSIANNFGTFQRNGTQLQLRAAVGGAVNLDGLESTSGGGNDQAFSMGSTFNSGLPIAINAINAGQIMFARRGLYESLDMGDTLTNLAPMLPGKGATERVISLAYGGMRAGMSFAGVFYAGTDGGNLYVRDEANNIFQRNIPGATGQVKDLTIDANDWRIAYVIQGNSVYWTNDAGMNWMALDDGATGNLEDLTSELRTITLFDNTPLAGDGVVFVGGFTGVFREILGDATPLWTEFGTGLPNAIVQDLHYEAAGDLLLAGTFGRGAWTIPSLASVAGVTGLVQVNGDDPVGQMDFVTLSRDTNPLLLDVALNGSTLSVEWGAVQGIEVNGMTDDDTLIIDLANGDVIPFDGITFNGGTGSDTLDIRNAAFDTVSYTTTGAASGTIELDADDLVEYTGTQLVVDRTSANHRVFTASGAGAQTIVLDDDGSPFDSRSRIDSGGSNTFAAHEFANPATSLTIEAGGGGDDIQLLGADPGFAASVTINAGNGNDDVYVATAPTQTNVNGGAGDDDVIVDFGNLTGTVNVAGDGDEDSLLVNGTALGDMILATGNRVQRGAEVVNYNVTVEHLTVDAGAGNDDVTIDGASGEILGGLGLDDFVVLASAAPALRVDGEAGSDDYTVFFGELAGPVTIEDLGPAAPDFDQLEIFGTPLGDTLLVTATAVTSDGEAVNYSGIEELVVDAGGGDDDITIDSTSPPTTVFGGDGDDDFFVNGSGPEDLTLDGQEDSDSYTINLGASLLGTVIINDTGLVGIDTLVVNGTPGDDVIILMDDSVTGTGGNVMFMGIEVFEVHAGAGDDLVDGSALTISVTIFGGTGDDTLIGGSNDDFLYGEEDNDDLIGNLGADYLDGGSGSDGLVGDQGTIVRELVAGPAKLLSIPGGRLQALINRPGTLRRNVTLIDEDVGGNDTLVGGEGDDYLHGGAGDDLLNGDAGNDALFGDNGNDMLAGGADDDHLYGGAGDDTLDGDAGADIAYGGDGQDRLIADSRDDRLIDWLGNFNEFVVPGPGLGAPVIVRSPSPWVQNFLLQLGADDGATNPNAELRVVVPGGSAQKGNSGKG
jgi:Ca2+-binding RTX toxin-like protein